MTYRQKRKIHDNIANKEIITEEDVKLYFSLYSQISSKIFPDNLKEYLFKKYDTSNLFEVIYLEKNNIKKIPICPICNKRIEYKNYGYTTYCSYKCSTPFKSKEVQEEIKKGFIKKYGVDNILKLKEIKDKVKETKLKKYGDENYNNQEKIKNTCLQKYGVESPLANKDIWNKTREHTIEKYGSAYNKEKYCETIFKKYGTKYYVESDDFKNKVDYIEISNKGFITKKRNKSYNKSILEEKSYNLLKEKYLNVIRQYKSKEYPFNCDFYIPSLNLYIECNYFWTHGNHPFNENNLEDINKLNYWKNKNTKFFNNAIETWTIRDVNKRNIAKKNNLNFIEFFKLIDLETWIKNGENNNR